MCVCVCVCAHVCETIVQTPSQVTEEWVTLRVGNTGVPGLQHNTGWEGPRGEVEDSSTNVTFAIKTMKLHSFQYYFSFHLHILQVLGKKTMVKSENILTILTTKPNVSKALLYKRQF